MEENSYNTEMCASDWSPLKRNCKVGFFVGGGGTKQFVWALDKYVTKPQLGHSFSCGISLFCQMLQNRYSLSLNLYSISNAGWKQTKNKYDILVGEKGGLSQMRKESLVESQMLQTVAEKKLHWHFLLHWDHFFSSNYIISSIQYSIKISRNFWDDSECWFKGLTQIASLKMLQGCSAVVGNVG